MHALFFWKSSQTAARGLCTSGASSLQGRRPSQEDRFYACDQLPEAPDCGFFAVYDGHGGHRAATFANEAMHKKLVETKGFKARDLSAGLQQAFLEVETEFLSIANTEGLSDGTTALAAVIQDGTSMTIAHVGDSRGVLCRDGEAVVVTHDHKPELEEERRRIEAAGGFVSYIGCWRAMGILAMSRAIGDIFLKPYVSAIPDVRVVQLGDRDEFVVLASDGVYDVFDNDEVVTIARGASDPQQAANVLTSSAFAAGSLDNLTAVVIALNGYSPKPRAALSVVEPAQTFHASAPSSGANPASWLTPPARFGVASNWRYNTWLDLAGF